MTEPRRRKTGSVEAPTYNNLVEEYLISQENKLAESYRLTQKIHLGHLKRHLGKKADRPCHQIGFRDLDQYVQARLKTRDPNTVCRERISLIQFFKWAVTQGHFTTSPATGLEPIKGGADLAPFRTVDEITKVLARGGLNEDERRKLWECLYLNPAEIASLLQAVRQNARRDVSLLLHAIPAYTGMRRGEVLRLKWIDIDFDNLCITARSRKQSRKKRETTRRIDMHPELMGVLNQWRQQRPKGQFVLTDPETLEPLNNDQANRDFWQPMRGTEWCLNSNKNWFKIGFHTYRHSFASSLAALGVDQRIIDEWMGHQTEAMRKRYRHLFPKSRTDAIARFSFAVPAENSLTA